MPTIRSYTLPIQVRQTATTAAGALVWAMRNLGVPGRVIYLRRLAVNVLFDGTGAASQSSYQPVRFRGATPTGGVALTPFKPNFEDATLGAASVVTDARVLDTGLTVAGVTFDGGATQIPAASFGCQRGSGPSAQYLLDYPGYDATGFNCREPVRLKLGDGLALALGQVAVIGDGIQGLIEWDEVGGAAG